MKSSSSSSTLIAVRGKIAVSESPIVSRWFRCNDMDSPISKVSALGGVDCGGGLDQILFEVLGSTPPGDGKSSEFMMPSVESAQSGDSRESKRC
jgi:hypothetical protein